MNFVSFFVICLICIAVVQPCNSQVIVVPSTIKVTIDGKSFYLHTVQPGETLYSISKAYNVPQEYIIISNNPNIREGLKSGEELRIPVESEVPTNSTQETEQFIRHITEQGQTIYWLTRNYNITEEDLYQHNPELKGSMLQAGQVVRIPQKTKPHTIPVNNNDTILVQHDVALFDVSECFETSKNEFRIAMFLSLFIDENFPASAPNLSVTRDSEGRYKYRDGLYWISSLSANALEFYQGAMLAIDSLKQTGLNARIDVYDTMRDTSKITQLLSNPEMNNTDLIIGPFTSELVDRVTDFARENNIYYVSPTAISAMSIRNNPYLIQVNSGEINTVTPIVNYIASQTNIHITLIGNNSESDQTLFNSYLNNLRAIYADSIFTVVHMSIESLQAPNRYLKRGVMNVVIIPSSSEAFVSIVTGQLNAASNIFQINVYGLAIWTKFVNLDLEYLHKLEFRYATAFYIDYVKPSVQNFLKKFKTVYHIEPTMLTGSGSISPYPYQFAFLGYDVTYFFLSALKRYGENFGNCISEFRMNMLQSEFHFERIDPYSGYRNSNFDIYKYSRDYTIVKEMVNEVVVNEEE